MQPTDQAFYAYRIHERADMPITCAPVGRGWMDASDQGFAYRCLPLTIANQGGWSIPCPVPFIACWDGGQYPPSVRIAFEPGCEDRNISSHFGSGVLTFSIPYLFRTPPSVNLWVKGPSNRIKDGVQALEGIVETDWTPAPFTMNWKFTRPNYPVRFERGEPICMVVPVAVNLLESLEPAYVPLHENPELHEQYLAWMKARAEFLVALQERRPDAVKVGWQKDYSKGVLPGGSRPMQHRTRLHLREFQGRTQVPGSAPAPPVTFDVPPFVKGPEH